MPVVPFALLLVAIAIEVAATSLLPRANGFRDPLWTGVVLLGYALSIWLLAVVVEHLPVSTAYAVWSGLGTASVAVIGWVWLGESGTWVTASALAMIVVGVVLLNLQGGH
jgi:small multidrug resistance pump